MIRRAGALLRRIFGPATWAGVYAGFQDVPARGGYERNEWISATRQRTTKAMTVGGDMDDFVGLVTLAGAVLRGSSSVRVLDFGGGMGVAYAALRRSLGVDAPIACTVVDLPRVVEEGRALFANDSRIVFSADLPPGQFDIVHTCGALQYVEEPFAALRGLLAYRAPYVLITKIPAGDNPTYATAQLNVPGSLLPCWMFDAKEVDAAVLDAGYVIRSRMPSDLSLIRTYRTRGIPRSHRPDRWLSLLLTPR